jgi:hypothetical protein
MCLLCYRRSVLEEVAQYTSLCSEKFHEVQSRIESSIEAVKPNQEYRDFTEKHKYSEYILIDVGEWLVLYKIYFLCTWRLCKITQRNVYLPFIRFTVYAYGKIISLHK